jgi:mRNA interferase RelE/StbE
MAYTVEIRPAFRRELKKLSQSVQSDVIEMLEVLQEDPFPEGFLKVEGNRCILKLRSPRFILDFCILATK